MSPLRTFTGVFCLGFLIGVGSMYWWDRGPVVPQSSQSGDPVRVQARDLSPKTIAPLVQSPTTVRIVQGQVNQGRSVETVAEATGTVRVQELPNFNKVAQPRFTEQRIGAVATMSTDKKGNPFATIDLFQIEAYDHWVPLADVETRIITASPLAPRWHSGFAVQGGIAMGQDQKPFAAVGVQWLRRGSRETAEDSTFSLLSPFVLLDQKQALFALAPISFNLGRLPHNPLNDLWLSPLYLPTSRSVALLLSATF